MDKEDLINGYLEGSLSERELAEFDRLRRSDPDFAADLTFETELRAALRKKERVALKNEFREAREAPTGDSKVVPMRPWLIAASVALLLGLGAWLLFLANPGPSPQTLYVENFVPYENVVHPIERGNSLQDIQTRAFTAYESRDYKTALTLFETLIDQKHEPYIEFYTAIVHMQLANPEVAIPYLKNYIAKGGQLRDRALWYLALAHLNMEEIDESKERLRELIALDSYHQEAASDLLEALD